MQSGHGEVKPVTSEAEPGAQREHIAVLGSCANEPAAHGLQTPVERAVSVPAGHGIPLQPSAQESPAVHGTQIGIMGSSLLPDGSEPHICSGPLQITLEPPHTPQLQALMRDRRRAIIM